MHVCVCVCLPVHTNVMSPTPSSILLCPAPLSHKVWSFRGRSCLATVVVDSAVAVMAFHRQRSASTEFDWTANACHTYKCVGLVQELRYIHSCCILQSHCPSHCSLIWSILLIFNVCSFLIG